MTQLAKCCKPVPPDPVRGFVTRGKGVTVHREDCASLKRLAERSPERLIDAQWGAQSGRTSGGAYPVDILVTAADRQGLLRDIGEALARERINVTAVRTQSRDDLAHMRFSFEVADVAHLRRAFAAVKQVAGVIRVARAAEADGGAAQQSGGAVERGAVPRRPGRRRRAVRACAWAGWPRRRDCSPRSTWSGISRCRRSTPAGWCWWRWRRPCWARSPTSPSSRRARAGPVLGLVFGLLVLWVGWNVLKQKEMPAMLARARASSCWSPGSPARCSRCATIRCAPAPRR